MRGRTTGGGRPYTKVQDNMKRADDRGRSSLHKLGPATFGLWPNAQDDVEEEATQGRPYTKVQDNMKRADDRGRSSLHEGAGQHEAGGRPGAVVPT